MNLNLTEKVVIVTGGAKGIGEGIVSQLALEGAFPVIVGRKKADNEEALAKVQAAGGFGFTVEAELSKPEECEKAVKAVMDRFGRIDGLVNNAGINDGVGLENGSAEAFMQSISSNVLHYYLMAHYALPALKESKGSIVNITSKVADTGQGGTSGYAASNGGRNALTREWAVELLKYGIRVNAIVVAECYTPMYDRWIQSLPDGEAQLEQIKNRIPLGNRMTTTEELANMTVFLLSKRSSHTTGQIMYVDGGYVHLDRSLIKK
ncbi:SDR family oxidoreductase [Marinilongibacter aquaticus]|uniref:SDR family oxidoreductase n=1 Tax=Marinilongibacter aquaticus TaxID=2975157 RepID=UPI0021BD9E24|nr:SDR family oxidoreductase [Marinilongibacter aquaticus]UBM57784.1 SDR family oxidoreductase [Marinilongibacter aquaticus]